jgi:hypothetical protein
VPIEPDEGAADDGGEEGGEDEGHGKAGE